MKSVPKQAKIPLLFFCLLLVNTPLLFAFDFSLRPKGFVSIPTGEGNIASGNEVYNMGGGSDIGLEIDLSSILPNPLGLGYTLGVEGGMIINPLKNDNAINVNFFSFGGAMGLYFFPLSRLLMRADGAIGAYQSAIEDLNGESITSPQGTFLRAGGELGFRFTPGFTLAANAGWRQYQSAAGSEQPEILNSGFYSGLTAQLTFQIGRRSSEGIGAALNQYGSVFPAFMQIYQSSPIGNVVIRNNENAEIRDVQLSFRADGHTASEFPCASVPIILKGRSLNMPLLADFSPEILRFTDGGRIMGELVVRYKFLGRQRETVRAVTVTIHNRNMITDDDISELTSFISPTSPETLDFARFIAGLARTNPRLGHNQNMSYAIWLLEGLKASQFRINNTEMSNTVQFPAETLSSRSGTIRDMTVLFASCLEGVGIGAGFIQTKDETLVAVSLDINQNAAETFFNGTDKILIVNDNVWLPLSLASINDGFMACWTQGAAKINQVFRAGEEAQFVIVREAWAIYPPALMPEMGRNAIRTDTAAATREVNRFFQRYIEQEINPLIRAVSGGQGTLTQAARQNRLGILYARAGRIAEAKAAYERAAGLGSVPAMTNRANLALTERDYATAERWFRQALQRESDNRAALRGMERIAGRR